MDKKIYAKIRTEKSDDEKVPMWTSYDGETMQEFLDRIKKSGANPDNYLITDPVDASLGEELPEVDPLETFELEILYRLYDSDPSIEDLKDHIGMIGSEPIEKLMARVKGLSISVDDPPLVDTNLDSEDEKPDEEEIPQD